MIPVAARRHIYHEEQDIVLLQGDCLEVMAALETASVSTIITDPPYGLSFMGKDWDHGVPGSPFWTAALEVCKPGAMMLAFGGTRTHHRLMCAIEDAGWELRDVLMWLYGSGFPKSHDISKAIDREAGAEREKIFARNAPSYQRSIGNTRPWMSDPEHRIDSATPATPEAERWKGWGTALKPAWEPIVLAMKPLDGTFAQNALKHGVAGIHVDGGRIGTEERHSTPATPKKGTFNCSFSEEYRGKTVSGRWPANVLFDDESAAILDEQSGELTSGANPERRGSDKFRVQYGEFKGQKQCQPHRGASSGGASRFFYVAKADNGDRGNRPAHDMPLFGETVPEFRNTHPTVKPTALAHKLLQVFSYLARLTESPTGGIVLDPFGGSGWMPVVCKAVGRPCIMIEKEKAHLDIAVERLRQGVLI